MKITIYIDVITYILKIHFFLLFVGYNRTTKVRNTGLNHVLYTLHNNRNVAFYYINDTIT